MFMTKSHAETELKLIKTIIHHELSETSSHHQYQIPRVWSKSKKYFKARIASFIVANIHILPQDYIIYIFLGMTEYNQSFLHGLPFLLKFFLKELRFLQLLEACCMTYSTNRRKITLYRWLYCKNVFGLAFWQFLVKKKDKVVDYLHTINMHYIFG